MTEEARREIFTRVRGATHMPSSEDAQAQLASLGDCPAASNLSEDIAQAFLARVISNQGSVSCVSSRSEAVQAIGAYLYRHHQTHKLIAGNDPRLAAMPWRDGKVLPRFDVAEDEDLAALSYARLAVAESGSIVTFTGKRNPSTNNLLVEDHLVLVDVEDIVQNYEQGWQRIGSLIEAEGRPRGINFISGPSCTADIAGHTVMGAHGPIRWHVILLGTALPPDLLQRAEALAL